MRKILFLMLVLLCSFFQVQAQFSTLNAHSHNDYQQKTPFFQAYIHHFGSIEADIWEVNGDLFVAHDKENINPERSLDKLYINPIVELYKQNGGKAWSDQKGSFQLLIELKSPVEPTLSLLAAKLKKYPEVFNPNVNKNAVRVAITGNRPEPSKFVNYPEFIQFDGKLDVKYTNEQRKRIALFSENLERFTSWSGNGNIPEAEHLRLKQVIDSIHDLKGKIRFWNAPDSPNAWKNLIDLNVDLVNTDHIPQLSKYLTTK